MINILPNTYIVDYIHNSNNYDKNSNFKTTSIRKYLRTTQLEQDVNRIPWEIVKQIKIIQILRGRNRARNLYRP